jgi:hypothetical protein
MTLSLHRKPCDPALLLNVPPEPTHTGNSGPISVTSWPSMPYSPTSKIQLPPLQVFAQQYRTGSTIAPKSKPVRSRTIEDALRSVGQTFAGLGKPDPLLRTSDGNIDFASNACSPPRLQEERPSPESRQTYSSPSPLSPGNLTIADMCMDQKRNLKTPIKTRTLHLSEPYASRSTTHTAMQPRKDKN